MAVDSLSDETRIAQLLASKVTGYEDAFSVLSTVDSDPDVEPTDDGTLTYVVAADGERVAKVYVQSSRAHVEFLAHPDVVAEIVSEAGLHIRSKAVHPPRTLVFIKDDAQVEWTLPAFRALVVALDTGGREEDEGWTLSRDRFRNPRRASGARPVNHRGGHA